MKIAVFGLGYVGSTLSVMLARKHEAAAVDLNPDRVKAVCTGYSPIGDALMDRIMQTERLNLAASDDPSEALKGADYVVIATNTELDKETGKLNTASVESVIGLVADFYRDTQEYQRPAVVIRSTVPTGFTKKMGELYPGFNFLFCPEFLREKTAMQDVLNPSRIVIGCDEKSSNAGQAAVAVRFAEILLDCVDNAGVPVVYTGTQEAEAVKLFSNSYLATRIAFFNELDSFAKDRGLDTEQIIHGVCLDPRIGDYYNVPGPGFAGACLPKDIRQLLADFQDLPEALIRGVIESNEMRKESFHEKNSEQ